MFTSPTCPLCEIKLPEIKWNNTRCICLFRLKCWLSKYIGKTKPEHSKHWEPTYTQTIAIFLSYILNSKLYKLGPELIMEVLWNNRIFASIFRYWWEIIPYFVHYFGRNSGELGRIVRRMCNEARINWRQTGFGLDFKQIVVGLFEALWFNLNQFNSLLPWGLIIETRFNNLIDFKATCCYVYFLKHVKSHLL